MTAVPQGDASERYFADGILAVQTMRRTGVASLAEFFRRLETDLRLDASPPAGPASTEARHAASPLLVWLRSWPRYFRQLLMELRPAGGDDCVLAISAARLECPAIASQPRRHLLDLVRPLPGTSPYAVLDQALTLAGRILCFDPAWVSPYRPFAAQLARESVSVVDVGYVIFRALPSAPRSLWRVLRPGAPLRATGFRSALFAELLVAGYRCILGRRPSAAFLLTSNSFATECLRLELLRTPGCRSVTELLHGVPSLEFMGYFHTLLRLAAAAGNGANHRFIGQLPELPLQRATGVGTAWISETAINAYFNRYFILHPLPGAEAADRLHRELESILPASSGAPRPLLVMFAGGNSHDADFLQSSAFRAECALLVEVAGNLRADGHAGRLVYCPHPRHDSAAFARHPFLREYDVAVYRETLYGWLVADACLSLLSSGLFEAVHLGIDTFSPLIAEDRIYSPELLDRLVHPVAPGREALRTRLQEFLRTTADKPRPEPVSRALKRLQRLQSP